MFYGNKIYPLQDKIMAALNGEGAFDCLALTLFSSNLFQGILIQLGQ